jgi:hypothetical protein
MESYVAWNGSCFMVYQILRQISIKEMGLRVALHLEARPIPLETDCMKFQSFWGWKLASTTHYNKIITGANFPICKGLRAKKLGLFYKSRIVQRI